MATESTTLTGAAHWASYLVNGDDSGLSAEEVQQADNWLKIECEGGWRIVSVEGDERFTWHYAMHTHTEFSGGSVVEYVALREKPE